MATRPAAPPQAGPAGPGRVTVYRTRVRWRDPQSLFMARFLGWLHGKAIAGVGPAPNGAVRYGGPGEMASQRSAYTGYVFPPQIFTGYKPERVAGGRARVATPALGGMGPTPQGVRSSPLERALDQISAAQRLNLPRAWGAGDG